MPSGENVELGMGMRCASRAKFGQGVKNEKSQKINIETRRSTTLKQRVILVQGPC